MSDVEFSESENRGDLSSLDSDESADSEHFIPPSQRFFNRHNEKERRIDEAHEYLTLKHIPASIFEDTSDEEPLPTTSKRTNFLTNQYHSVVFPGKKIPVKKYSKSKKAKNSNRGEVQLQKKELAPAMLVECPLPGGEAVTVVTDPVERASWGPLTRIEATKKARDMVKDWNIAVATAGMKDSKRDEKNKAKVTPPSKVQGDEKTNKDDETEHPTSQAETDVSNLRARYLSPPPPTPPEAIFHARLSMPTLPNLHLSSDPEEVERYRVERAKDPVSFDKETRNIKRNLVDLKIARGGKSSLLQNEYTVELACREDAVMAEKWASGKVASTRSRSDTTGAAAVEIADQAVMRGGEIEEPSAVAKVFRSAKDKLTSIAGLQNQGAELKEEIGNVGKKDSTDSTETAKGGIQDEKNFGTTATDMKAARNELKAKLKSFDLPSHVGKVIASGMVRHQHSEKREITQLGEKRTVTTWIQIEEVYEVPAPSTLTWKDVAIAVEQEEYDEDEGKGNKKGLKYKNDKAKRHSRSAVSGKQRKTEDVSSDSDDSDDSTQSSTSDEQTRTESLLEALSRSDKLNEQGISALAHDLKRVLTTLRGNGQLKVEEEG
ncbi:hypothetical protein LTR84_006285 [Exophiala bonariae]|uniref:Uncharacterized protein n=1 Tax=Exophiala bonariae TaxID=1690606 RepID=A0AAV9N228_9EURO|nr:hypothetical protein LTR84_006285 [Exophiala bonariae]